uniref:Peptidase C51 domain-containing protein n=1 Tax=uncultured bacterium Contigcl_30 TaxID=1393670 RepID=W0FL42_9BACT|nr:hypothetical protein [uncultured bacterium Contigcl_30]
MHCFKRFLSILTVFVLLSSSALAAKKKAKPTATPMPAQIEETVIAEPPEIIQKMLDIAYAEWETTAGKALKKSNKYTKWWNNYEWEWCAGFTTWCTLEAGIPQDYEDVILSREEGPVKGIYSCKASSPTKLIHTFSHMHRTTMIPQKGFIILYGVGSDYRTHVGLVYDVQQLPDGKYRITTIEGNMSNTVRMYTADYEPVNVYQEQKHDPKVSNLSAVPPEEQEDEESRSRTYVLRKKKSTKRPWYVTCFLMPWVPGETSPDGEGDTL